MGERGAQGWIIVGAGLGGAGLAAHLGGLGWPFEPFANLAPQIGLALCVFGSWALVRRRLGFAVGAFALSLSVLWPVATYSRYVVADPKAAGERLTLFWCNLHSDPRALVRAAALARAADADIVAFSEVPGVGAAQLARLFPDHPARIDTGAEAAARAFLWTRIVVLSREPLNLVDIVAEPPFAGRPFVVAELPARGRRPELRLIALHPVPPFTPGALAARDRLLPRAADETHASKSWVLLGDLNIAPWAPGFRAIGGARAGDPRREATFWSRQAGLGFTIDHVMLGPGVGLASYRVGPGVGSDHLPLIAEIALGPAG